MCVNDPVQRRPEHDNFRRALCRRPPFLNAMSPKPPFALISPRASRPEPGIHSERRSQLAAGATSATLTVHKVLGA